MSIEKYLEPDTIKTKCEELTSQSIGEAIYLFSRFIKAIIDPNSDDKQFGDIFFKKTGQLFQIEFTVPADYRDNKVISDEVYSYRASFVGSLLLVCAYGKDGKPLPEVTHMMKEYYKLLPAFCAMFSNDYILDGKFHYSLDKFIGDPSIENFALIHSYFCRKWQDKDVNLQYGDIEHVQHILIGRSDGYWRSFSDEMLEKLQKKDGSKEGQLLNKGYFPSNVFDEDQLQFIPMLSKEFSLQKELRSICRAVVAGDSRAVLLHGPAGTGKTMGCRLVCQTIKLPIMATINCTENLDEFVLGKFIPEGDKIVFKESGVTDAIRRGGAVIFEEINFAKPQHLAFLNSLLDDNGFVRLDNGDIVHRNKNFRFFATMNIGYFGTKELNQALYNRFNVIIEIAALSDEAIKNMLTVRVPTCSLFVDKMLGVYHKLQKKIEEDELDVVISPRNLENWARMAKYDGYIIAAQKTIIPIAKCDRDFEKVINDIMMLYVWM